MMQEWCPPPPQGGRSIKAIIFNFTSEPLGEQTEGSQTLPASLGV